MRLDNKTVIVTGAASGLGAAISEKFAEHGANVALWDINESGLEEQKKKLEKYGVKVEYYITNVCDFNNVQENGKSVIGDFGKIDILVNCAGGGRDLASGFRELDEASWKRQLDLNLNSQFYCCKAVIEHMVENKYGKIINLSSVAGMRGGGLLGKGAYSTSKAGVIGMTKALAKELGPHGININTVAPALHITPLTAGNLSEEKIQEIKDGFPLKTAGEPADLGEIVVFLASDAAKFITGALITADGGYTMH